MCTGYTVIEKCECEWSFEKQYNNDVLLMCRELNMTNLTLLKDQFLQLLMTDELYGLALVDIHVPDHLKEYFEELPPIFKNKIVNRSDLDSHMKEFLVANGIMSTGWRCLLASYFGEKVLLTTDHIKWCLIHSLIVRKCHLFKRYNREKPFKDFLDFVSYNRRLGDADVDKTVIAQTSKLIGNSARPWKTINQLSKIR